MAYTNASAEKTQISRAALREHFARLKCCSAPQAPTVTQDCDAGYERRLYSAAWGLDKDQDVARSGLISKGPYKGSVWMAVFDGHGEGDGVPAWLRRVTQDQFETWMSTNDAGSALEQQLARDHPLGFSSSGACAVLSRISQFGVVEMWNAGDSRGKVIAQLPTGEIRVLTATLDQTPENESELRRLLREKHPDFVAEHPEMTTVEALQEGGLQCGLLTRDSSMLKVLEPAQGSSCPRATMASGLRANFSAQEAEYQMTRSIGHRPLGVTGTNWDYYRTRLPIGARVHVVLSSDGLWDVEPSPSTLFEWCEEGGDEMLHQIANRWVQDWDFEHHWTHNCAACVQRRVDFLEKELQTAVRETDEARAHQIRFQLLQDQRQLESALRVSDPDASASLRPRIAALAQEVRSAQAGHLHDFSNPIVPAIPYNGESIRSVQPGLKPDDLSLALCSFTVKGHITCLKGLVSRMDTPEVQEFALDHPLLGEHCIGVHFDGDGHNPNGMQDCIARIAEREDPPAITAALRQRPQEEQDLRAAAGQTTDIVLDNETEHVTSWNARLGEEVRPHRIDICAIEGPAFGDDHTRRYAQHGNAHLRLVLQEAAARDIPVAVMCVGSGKVTQLEHSMAPPEVSFFMVNADRPLNKCESGRECPSIAAPSHYPAPEEVDWTPDPSGNPLLPSPQMWVMHGGSTLRYSPQLPICGVQCSGADSPIDMCVGVTMELQRQSRPGSA